MCFVVGMWFQNIAEMIKRGYSLYLDNAWNIYDVLMLSLFTATFICWGLASTKVAFHPVTASLPRYYWWEYDCRLVGEALYAYAILLAFPRLLFYMQINDQIGPLQVILLTV